MAFPKSADEMKAQGYVFDNDAELFRRRKVE